MRQSFEAFWWRKWLEEEGFKRQAIASVKHVSGNQNVMIDVTDFVFAIFAFYVHDSDISVC